MDEPRERISGSGGIMASAAGAEGCVLREGEIITYPHDDDGDDQDIIDVLFDFLVHFRGSFRWILDAIRELGSFANAALPEDASRVLNMALQIKTTITELDIAMAVKAWSLDRVLVDEETALESLPRWKVEKMIWFWNVTSCASGWNASIMT